MLTVTCVLRSGGDFVPDDVARLARGVERNLTLPHLFTCLTDDPVGVSSIISNFAILNHDWPGWWAKMEVYRLLGPVLYFDLDTVIVGNIDALGMKAKNAGGDLLMLHDFYRPDHGESGILGWAGEMRYLYRSFCEAVSGAKFDSRRHGIPMKPSNGQTYAGDGDWTWRHAKARIGFTVEDGVYSYKYHIRSKKLCQPPDDAVVVCFHGHPRPRDVSARWIGR
jgi:hypothetical protein